MTSGDCPVCNTSDPLVVLLREHMRVAVEDGTQIKCWCNGRFPNGDAHREHVAALIRELLDEG